MYYNISIKLYVQGSGRDLIAATHSLLVYCTIINSKNDIYIKYLKIILLNLARVHCFISYQK